jgi:hypothetical protein
VAVEATVFARQARFKTSDLGNGEIYQLHFMQIYLYQNDKQIGPYTEEQLREMETSGAISRTEYAWYEGLGEWQPLNKIISFVPAAPTFPPPPQKTNSPGKSNFANFVAIFVLLILVGTAIAALMKQQSGNFSNVTMPGLTSPSMSGIYSSENPNVPDLSIDFRPDGNCYLTQLGTQHAYKYTIDGDKVVINSMVFAKKGDTLSWSIQVLKKQ